MTKPIELNGVLCKHNVYVASYGGSGKHVVLFTDSRGEDYIWVTGFAGVGFQEGGVYDITARLDNNNKLSYVKVNSFKDKPDARDVLLGRAKYAYYV